MKGLNEQCDVIVHAEQLGVRKKSTAMFFNGICIVYSLSNATFLLIPESNMMYEYILKGGKILIPGPPGWKPLLVACIILNQREKICSQNHRFVITMGRMI